jgi:molybdopterin adenylyltransferase
MTSEVDYGSLSLMSVANHRAAAPASVRCFVLTVSDTRTLETDESGRVIAEMLTASGHDVVSRAVVADDPTAVIDALRPHLDHGDVRAIITTGGTGIAARDLTYEAVTTLFEKRLDGFGELFRMLSFEEVGPAAMLSRACAGIAKGRVIFMLPGSHSAVRLAMRRLILIELGHIVREITK